MAYRLSQLRAILEAGKTLPYPTQVWMLGRLEQAELDREELENLRELLTAGLQDMYDGMTQP